MAKNTDKSIRITFDVETAKGVGSLGKLQREAKKTGGAFEKEFGGNLKKVSNQAEMSAKQIDRAFNALGVRSTASYRRQLTGLVNAYNDLRRSGKLSAREQQRAYAGLQQSVARVKKEMREAGATGTQSMQRITRDARGLSHVFQTIGGAAALYKLQQGVRSSISSFAHFDDAVRAAAASMGASKEEFEALSRVAEEMGRTTRYTATEAAEGLLNLGRAGLTAQQSIAALPGVLQLAAAGGFELGEAADIATNILSGFNLETQDLARVNDVLVKTFTSTQSTLPQLGQAMKYVASIAAPMGVEFEELAAAVGMLHNAGIKADMAGTSLRGMLNALFNPTKQQADIMAALEERLGGVAFQVKDAEGNFVGFGRILQQLEQAGFKAEEALALFGQRAGPAVAALLSEGSKELERFRKELENSGGTAEQIASDMEEGLGGALREMRSVVAGLGITLGRDLEPIVRQLAGRIRDLSKWFSELSPNARYAAEAVLGLAAGYVALKTAMAGLGLVSAVSSLSGIASGAGIATAAVGKFSGAIAALNAVIVGPAGLVVALGAALAIMAKVVEAHIETKKVIEESYQAEKLGYEQASRNYLQLGKNLAEINKKYGTSLRLNKEGLIVMSEQDKSILRQAGALGKLSDAIDETSGRTPTIRPKVDIEQAEKDLKELTKPERENRH